MVVARAGSTRGSIPQLSAVSRIPPSTTSSIHTEEEDVDHLSEEDLPEDLQFDEEEEEVHCEPLRNGSDIEEEDLEENEKEESNEEARGSASTRDSGISDLSSRGGPNQVGFDS